MTASLANKFIKERFSPDKAIDILDLSAAVVKKSLYKSKTSIHTSLLFRYREILKRFNEAIANNDYTQ